MPTHAPTGSTSRSREHRHLWRDRRPADRAAIWTVPSQISGTSCSNSFTSSAGSVRDRTICGPLAAIHALMTARRPHWRVARRDCSLRQARSIRRARRPSPFPNRFRWRSPPRRSAGVLAKYSRSAADLLEDDHLAVCAAMRPSTSVGLGNSIPCPLPLRRRRAAVLPRARSRSRVGIRTIFDGEQITCPASWGTASSGSRWSL